MQLIRTLRVGDVGKDVEAYKRAVARLLGKGRLRTMISRAPLVRRTFGPYFKLEVARAQKALAIPTSGVIGPATHAALKAAGALDAYSLQLLREYAQSLKPALVEPLQGFASLHKSLWEAYSLGRQMGLTDLGTYNPASRLPSGAPSDHSVYPAFAFDLGIEPDTGWDNATAREYFWKVCRRPEIEYVILGNKIWTNTRGLRTYTAGGHLNHVHVSGRR